MTLRELISEITIKEGKKVPVTIGNVREIISILRAMLRDKKRGHEVASVLFKGHPYLEVFEKNSMKRVTERGLLIFIFLFSALSFGVNSPVEAIKRFHERDVLVDGHNRLPKAADFVPHNFLSIANKTSCELVITTKKIRIIVPPHSGYLTKKEEELCDLK